MYMYQQKESVLHFISAVSARTVQKVIVKLCFMRRYRRPSPCPSDNVRVAVELRNLRCVACISRTCNFSR